LLLKKSAIPDAYLFLLFFPFISFFLFRHRLSAMALIIFEGGAYYF